MLGLARLPRHARNTARLILRIRVRLVATFEPHAIAVKQAIAIAKDLGYLS